MAFEPGRIGEVLDLRGTSDAVEKRAGPVDVGLYSGQVDVDVPLAQLRSSRVGRAGSADT